MIVRKPLFARFLGLPLLSACVFAFAFAPTRAAVPDHSAKKMRFVVYGDTRDGHDVHRKLIALILAQKPEFVLQTGDLVHAGSDESLWKIYDEITAPLRAKVPVYLARGNHDLGGPGYAAHVTAPFTSGTKLYYSFDKGKLHFISIDSFSALNEGAPERDWLIKDLDAAQKKGLVIIPFFHVGPYSVGAHGSSPVTQKQLCPLFLSHRVPLVFNGHDHIYYHTKRDGITYVVSGGGGAPLYRVHADQEIPGDTAESVNHILVCDVDGKQITLTALRADGSQIEKFSVPLERPKE